MKRSIFLVLAMLIPLTLFAQGYYRYPAIHEQTIVFTSEGDLWKVGVEGGAAQRLTTHLGVEYSASISPDGKAIAFSAQYEGPIEVYTMPILGGLPVRRTYEGEQATVVNWTPDGKILYATRHYSTLPNTQLGIIDLTTGEPSLMPLHQAADGAFTEDGATLFFTRLPFQGSRTKRYEGGTAQNIWKFASGDDEAVALTADYAGTSKEPMWWRDRVYFATDRDGTMNLWSMNENGGDLQQHTQHRGWDIQSPSLHNGQIVYQLGADLHLYDIESAKDRKLDITLSSDFDQTRENWVKEPMQYLTDVHISPDGEKIALTARGRVFVAPAEQGRFVEVTRAQGVRYRNALFLPDKKSLLLLSDASGEFEFWQYPASGVGKGTQITSDAEIFRFEGTPSPDGKRLAFTDKNQQLWLYEFATKKTERIDASDKWGNLFDLAWSPDSRWLAYVNLADNYSTIIKLYNTADESTTLLTSDRVDSYSPTWSPDGKWLYFLSDRHFNSLVPSPWGPRQPEPFFDKTTKIYMTSLLEGEKFPFSPADETRAEDQPEEKKADESGKKEKDSTKVVVTKIDLQGLQKRIMEVPVPAGNYSGLEVNDERLFWIDTETSTERKRQLVALKIENKEAKPETIAKEIRSYDLSQDGKKLLIWKDKDIYVIKSSAGESVELAENKVDLSKWTFSVNPREEWRQMFVDAWRMERDYFYDPDLHGVAWKELLSKHLPLVDRVADRAELNDLIGQLVGELSALHMSVWGGDHRDVDDQIALASLGAWLKRDEAAGGYRVERIYQSEPDYLDRQGPLARPDVHVQEGDVIQAINGVSTLSVPHPRVLLKNQADQQVLITVKSSETGKTYDTIVTPISAQDEARLRYDEWELTRRLEVEEAGEGEIGYVHLRAMGGNNMAEWVRNFYPVFNRKGLIIDVRHNQGGNIDSWILEKLLRQAWFYWKPRVGDPYWNMQYAFRGHMVVLCNEWTASDGEAFAEGFRRLDLGKIIGTRTWGGEIWLSGNTWLVDRGIAMAPQFGVYGPEGEWLIEGHGVKPDIVVDNLPRATFNGKDAQLEAAVTHLQELIAADPRPIPSPPPYPDKSFDYEKMTNGGSGARLNEK